MLVHHHDDRVVYFTGDMALVGAPIAHVDHAQRACYAALRQAGDLREFATELRRQALSFSVRMGLNSGEFVAGRIGDDLCVDKTAQGHTVAFPWYRIFAARPGPGGRQCHRQAGIDISGSRSSRFGTR